MFLRDIFVFEMWNIRVIPTYRVSTMITCVFVHVHVCMRQREREVNGSRLTKTHKVHFLCIQLHVATAGRYIWKPSHILPVNVLAPGQRKHLTKCGTKVKS